MGCSPAFCGPGSSVLRKGSALSHGDWVGVTFINGWLVIPYRENRRPFCTSLVLSHSIGIRSEDSVIAPSKSEQLGPDQGGLQVLAICCGLPQMRSSALANQEVATVIGNNSRWEIVAGLGVTS